MTTRRKQKQKIRARYSKAREEAQLADVIPTVPEGAVRPERVDPALQGSAQLPEVVRAALRNNWATPDAAKPAIVANLLEPFFAERDTGPDGKLLPPDRAQLIELAKVLRLLDQTQFERDHPEEAGTAKGGGAVFQATQVMRANMVADPAAEAERAMAQTSLAFGTPAQSEDQTRP